MSEHSFKIGDLVELKCGSFPMVIQTIVEPNEYCKNTTVWTNFALNGEIRSNGFHPDVLIHAEIKKPWWAR